MAGDVRRIILSENAIEALRMIQDVIREVRRHQAPGHFFHEPGFGLPKGNDDKSVGYREGFSHGLYAGEQHAMYDLSHFISTMKNYSTRNKRKCEK